MTALLLALLASGHEDLELQIARITRRIEASPGDASLRFRRAELRRLHAEGEAARADYAEARALDPGLAAVDLGLGRLARAEGRPSEALRHLDAYVAARPEDPAGRLERARARAAAGAWAGAREDYDALLAALPDPGPDLHLERARALRATGSAEDALRAIDAAVERFGPIVTLVSEAVETELAAGRLEPALARIDVALTAPGRKDRWLLRRGEILERLGRRDAARGAWAAALREIEALTPARRRTRETLDLEADLRARLSSKESRP